jgi:hypothetical protein
LLTQEAPDLRDVGADDKRGRKIADEEGRLRIGAVARLPNVRDFRLTSGDKEIARRLGGTAKQVSQQEAQAARAIADQFARRDRRCMSDGRPGRAIEASRRNLAGETTRTSLVGTVGAHQTIH